MVIDSWEIRAAICLLVAILAACAPETDRARYEVGESGVATFHNQLGTTLYLGGCGHFDYEKRVGDDWVSQGPDTVCVWEGYADPVSPGEVVTDPIRAREVGTWRLVYAIGAGCSEAAPLGAGHCAVIDAVASNEFEVVEPACVVSGCSGQLCADEPMASTCLWLPHYACYRAARCGRFGAAGACGWEATPELEACLAEQGASRALEPIETPR